VFALALQAQLLEQVGALLGAFATERSRALSQGMQVGPGLLI
jgi:hypothetical protein